jgi:hypothetical protein
MKAAISGIGVISVCGMALKIWLKMAASGGGIGGEKQSAAGGGAASVKPAMAALAAAGRRIEENGRGIMAFNGGEMAKWRK